MPRDGANIDEEQDIPWHHAAEVMDYARVMRGGEDYMLEQFDAELAFLEQQEKEDELMFGEDNVEWMRKAVRAVHEAKEKVKGIGNPPEMKPAEPKPKRPPIVFNADPEDAPDMYTIQNAVKSGQSVSSTPQPSTLAPDVTIAAPKAETTDALSSTTRKLSVSSHSSRTSHGIGSTLAEIRNRQQHDHNHTPSEYFFYQALLHYYLSPLDIRILKASFGNFESFPSTILPRVERVSTGHVVDDELRKRTKYLAHLPYGCEVSFLECDWTDTVAPEVLERFKPEIEKRRKKNLDKETREEKARIRAEKAEYAEFASARRKRPSISEKFNADDFQPLAADAAAQQAIFQPGSVPDNSVPVDSGATSTSPPWPARRGQGFASLASPSTSPSTQRTVWGTTAIAPTGSPTIAPVVHDAVDDGWLQGWEKDLLQEEDLIAEAQALSLGEGEATPKKQAGGKKKKGKKITLMSTNVRRGA
jgi:hypothetical protein